MHLAEGTLPLSQALGWSALVVPVLIWSIRGESVIRREDSKSSVIMAGVTSVFLPQHYYPFPFQL